MLARLSMLARLRIADEPPGVRESVKRLVGDGEPSARRRLPSAYLMHSRCIPKIPVTSHNFTHPAELPANLKGRTRE